MAKLSVIMPVHDGVNPAELDEAIASIRNQSLRDFEFLIYADGVTKPSLKRQLAAAVSSDERIRLIEGAENRGCAFALNRLVEQAVGEYVARMDADDMSLPERLERQAAYLDAHVDVALVGTFAYEVDHAGQVLYKKSLPVDQAAVRKFMSRRDPFIHPTVMFRRGFFEKMGLYSEAESCRALEDTELWSRALVAKCGAANLPEYLFSFRINPTFYGRRRGWRYAWNEMSLRAGYVLKARLPWYHLFFPLAVCLVRISPGFVTRLIYQRARV